MTDQRQGTRDTWTPTARTLEQVDPDQTGPASSTQDSTARDSADADRPADDGTVYQSAAYDSAVDRPEIHQPLADGMAGERGTHNDTTEHPAGDDESLDAADTSGPTGHTDPDHVEPEHAVGVASVSDAEPAPDTVDRGVLDSPRVAAVTDTGQPVDVDERAGGAGGETPIVPAPMDDAASLNGARSGEMLPGDLPEEPGLALFDGETTELFRGRWQELQLRFVDDPHAAEGQAAALVDEVVTALRDAVDRQRRALHDWQSGQGVDAHSRDTEQMRVAVRRYRDFLDHLLGL